MKRLRACAVPLVTVDPYLNIWSASDNLYDEATRHWTGRRNSMTLLFKIDQKWYKVMGGIATDNYRKFTEPEAISQTDCIIEATKTTYTFENEIIKVSLFFRTPLLMDDLIMMSGPVSYIGYDVAFKDGKEHELQVYFDIGAEICVNDPASAVKFGETDYSIYCGSKEQRVLEEAGDDQLIDWGYLHLVSPGASYRVYTVYDKHNIFGKNRKPDEALEEAVVATNAPVISALKDFGSVKKANDFICIAYNDIYSIEYFGEKLKPYWTKSRLSFDDLVKKYISDYEIINKRCDEFDAKLREDASKINPEYADLICLTYRQVIAGHKLVEKDGELLFFSKECHSNGCIATVDVTYPSIPMFLHLNAELAKGLLNPVFEYATNNHGWEFEFAPHDVGTYPKANGQVYGYEKDDPEYILSMQMPVEECGNMLISTAAICKMENSPEYAKDKLEILKKWADYLIKSGVDPENQLSTEDFAGHLAHSCNLSVKGIVGIAAYGYILKMLGKDPEEYLKTAQSFATEWEQRAFENDHYRLAFDYENSWSLKYNLVWDKFFGFNLFDEKVFKTEVEYYKTKLNRYGVPLDLRKEYTLSFWQIWTICLTDDEEYTKSIAEAMWRYVNETPDRVPFPDWYESHNAVSRAFKNRTVQGGLFLPLLFNSISQ